MDQVARTRIVLGNDAVETLAKSTVAVFGIGGVGGYVAEALARSGVGYFYLIDKDTVSLTNINRQIIATHSTVGRSKTEVMKERILDINPDAEVEIFDKFFLPENSGEFPFDKFDYVVDAVDTVTAKIELALKCRDMNIPIISSMGAGNKVNPCEFKVADIYSTKVCPLAKVMRRELKKRDVKKLKVVYSEELPREAKYSASDEEVPQGKKTVPGSVAFVPSVAGLVIASEVIKDITGGY